MNENETGKSLSMQKVLLPGHDPGWNDPPQWAYPGTQNSTAIPTKRLLNKRVAFPLSPQTSDANKISSNSASTVLPPIQPSFNPTTASHSPLIPPSNVDATITQEIDKIQALDKVLPILEAVMNEHIDKSKTDEVKKRLDMLKTAWIEEKLNDTICKHIVDLSTALQEGDVQRADQIHLSLMMQHANLCSSWIPGIRHIILGIKAKQQNLTTRDTSN